MGVQSFWATLYTCSDNRTAGPRDLFIYFSPHSAQQHGDWKSLPLSCCAVREHGTDFLTDQEPHGRSGATLDLLPMLPGNREAMTCIQAANLSGLVLASTGTQISVLILDIKKKTDLGRS